MKRTFTRDEVHEYFADPARGGKAEIYNKGKIEARSIWLADRVSELGLDKDALVLEIGCNAGRNLEYLRRDGYTNLHGRGRLMFHRQCSDYCPYRNAFPSLLCMRIPTPLLLAICNRSY